MNLGPGRSRIAAARRGAQPPIRQDGAACRQGSLRCSVLAGSAVGS